MNCPSCNTVLAFEETADNTDKNSGITKCPKCAVSFKNDPKRNIILYSAGALAFFGGPINSLFLGENELLFWGCYTVAVGLFVWYYAMPKSLVIE